MQVTWIVIIFVLAVLISVGLMYLGHKIWRVDAETPHVRVLGMYSPILTWLKYRRLPVMQPKYTLKLNVSGNRHVSSAPVATVLPLAVAPAPAQSPDNASSFGSVQTIPPAETVVRPASNRVWPEGLPALNKWMVLELVLLLMVGVYFGRDLYDLDPTQWPPGSEASVFIGLNQAFLQEIQVGQFPLWQHTMYQGFPTLANADLTFFNPFVGPLSLMFGSVNGMKLALAFSFIWAGLGVWLLGWALGLQRPGRLWAGALYMVSGSMVTPLFTGIYPLELGAAWLPWVFAVFVLMFKTEWKWPRVAGVFMLAAVVFSGHVYYTGFVLGGLGVLLLVWTFTVDPSLRLKVAWKKLLTAVIAMAAAGGVAAIVIIPQAEIRNWLVYDAAVPASIDWRYAILNYIVANQDFYASGILGQSGGYTLEGYHYIGEIAFVFLLFLLPAIHRRRWREIVFPVGLVILGVLYASQVTPWVTYLGTVFPLIHWFRFPVRALVLGTIGLSVLSGFGVDYFFSLLDRWHQAHRQSIALVASDKTLRYLPATRGGQVLCILALGGMYLNGLNTNRTFVGLTPHDLAWEQDLATIKTVLSDAPAYLVNFDAAWIQYDAWKQGITFFDSEVGSLPFAPLAQATDLPIRAESQYHLINASLPVPPDHEIVTDKGLGVNILYRKTKALPYAFRADLQQLEGVDPAQYASLVTAVPARWTGPNQVELFTSSPGGERLIIFSQYYPGWEVWIDGQPDAVVRTTEYMSTWTLPGTHSYVFVFSPLSAKLGMIISLLTLLGVMVYTIVPDTRWRHWLNWRPRSAQGTRGVNGTES